jgi:hypothetical protein
VGAELAGKCVDLVRELLPSAHRVAALANAPDPFSRPFSEQVQLAGKATGTAIDPVMINSATELDAAFSAMERERLDAAIIQPSLPTKLVAALALTHRISAVSFVRSVAEEGAKRANLPVEQPTKFELVINLKIRTTNAACPGPGSDPIKSDDFRYWHECEVGARALDVGYVLESGPTLFIVVRRRRARSRLPVSDLMPRVRC